MVGVPDVERVSNFQDSGCTENGQVSNLYGVMLYLINT